MRNLFSAAGDDPFCVCSSASVGATVSDEHWKTESVHRRGSLQGVYVCACMCVVWCGASERVCSVV